MGNFQPISMVKVASTNQPMVTKSLTANNIDDKKEDRPNQHFGQPFQQQRDRSPAHKTEHKIMNPFEQPEKLKTVFR